MDQLCPKPHTMADKGCTEAGDQLPFAQVAWKLLWQLHGKQLLSLHLQKKPLISINLSILFLWIYWRVEAPHRGIVLYFLFSEKQSKVRTDISSRVAAVGLVGCWPSSDARANRMTIKGITPSQVRLSLTAFSQQHSVSQWVLSLPGGLLISSSHSPQCEKGEQRQSQSKNKNQTPYWEVNLWKLSTALLILGEATNRTEIKDNIISLSLKAVRCKTKQSINMYDLCNWFSCFYYNPFMLGYEHTQIYSDCDSVLVLIRSPSSLCYSESATMALQWPITRARKTGNKCSVQG